MSLVGGAVDSIDIHADSESFSRFRADASVIGVDIPIGPPDAGERAADALARARIGPRRSSVFSTPPRAALEADDYQTALDITRDAWGKGISKQAYGLRHRILDVGQVARTDSRIFEVHPEVSFREMNGRPLDYSKKTWNGQVLRRRLLRDVGIDIPEEPLEAGNVPVDDILDAAAAAWSAHRIAMGVAVSLPDPPERFGGREVAIWY